MAKASCFAFCGMGLLTLKGKVGQILLLAYCTYC